MRKTCGSTWLYRISSHEPNGIASKHKQCLSRSRTPAPVPCSAAPSCRSRRAFLPGADLASKPQKSFRLYPFGGLVFLLLTHLMRAIRLGRIYKLEALDQRSESRRAELFES